MSSDYFIAPVAPNFFSLQAVDNLSLVFRNWTDLLDPFKSVPTRRGIRLKPKFLGIIVNTAKVGISAMSDGEQKSTAYAAKWGSQLNKKNINIS